MGIKRIVDVSFWTDGKVDEFSPEDKYFMLYLLTNPFTTQLGIYELSIKQAAFQLGYSAESVTVLIDRFENKYKIIFCSKETNEIAVKNFLRHSIIKGGRPVEDCLKKEISKVKDRSLLMQVFNYIQDKDDLNETVKKIINEYDNDNDNDNDNDVSSTNRQRIVNESQYKQIKNDVLDNKNEGDEVCEWCGCRTSTLHKCQFSIIRTPFYIPKKENGREYAYICSNCRLELGSKKPSKKPTKHKYGEYNNVLLTDDELEKLKAEYSDYEERIDNLSSYIASKGDKYKSHYATIRNWAKKDTPKKEVKKSAFEGLDDAFTI